MVITQTRFLMFAVCMQAIVGCATVSSTPHPACIELRATSLPFYVIGHNPDTPDAAIRQLKLGFNALGPNLRFTQGELRVDNQFMLGNIAIQWPRDNGTGPTLSDYLKSLRTAMQAQAVTPPALIVWDLKPPFQSAWMEQALITIRTEFTQYYPNTAIALTVGELNGAREIATLLPLLRKGEAIGIDDYMLAEEAFKLFSHSSGVFIYANRNRPASTEQALLLRGQRMQEGANKNSLALVFGWTINSPTLMRQLLQQPVDAMMVDEQAIHHLCSLLLEPPIQEKIRESASQNPLFRLGLN
jgi:hypothetical protein